ncbi:MAG: rRNA methyltransferase [Deltaproteobacteria bacterium]|nr:rRNA methyltransferase [Deltaproteobacteria bacterium]
MEVVKRNREKRHRYGKFFVEGVSAINLAIKYGWKFDSFIFSSAKPLSNWAEQVLNDTRAENYFDLTPELLQQLSDKEETSEVLALVCMRSTKLSDVAASPTGLIVVFDRPSSPGNLGTLIRSADAFGADAIVISGHAVDPYDTQVLRASVGTFFAHPVLRVESHEEVLQWVNQARAGGLQFKVLGTSAKAEQVCSEADLSGPCVLLLGNETSGLSRGYKEMSDILLKIPINGVASSLNVSCAASILLYELQRQRSASK